MERVNPRDSKVQDLASHFRNNGWDNVPLIKVFKDGTHTYVIDGNHRVVAARQANLESVPVIYLEECHLKDYNYNRQGLIFECAE